jgi:hypothetical protein
MTRGDLAVFLGPSLPIVEARRLLAARFLPPVQCGDIFRLRRLRPGAVAIIDGLFETTGAVWHKEILFALEDGIPVFGASSMGALRAAELEPFGMIGFGAIFQAYRDGVYTDDDEVALLHGPAEYGYPPRSEAMVNIRATVAGAVDGGVIGHEAADRLIGCAKGVFYQERTLAGAIALAWGIGSETATRFQQFLDRGGYVDQKREDARALLKHLAHLDAASTWPRPQGPPAHRSSVVLRLHQELAGDVPATDAPDLPRDQRVARQVTSLGRTAPLLRQLSQLLSVVHAIGRTAGEASAADRARATSRHDFGLGPQAGTRRWRASHDLDADGAASLVDRLGVINRTIDGVRRTLGPRAAAARQDTLLLALLRVVDRYVQWRPRTTMPRARVDRAVLLNARRRGGVEFAICRRMATLWSTADWFADDRGLAPRVPLQEHSDEFRRDRGLDRRAATLAWRRANNLDQASYEALVACSARLSMLLEGSLLHALGLVHIADPACWFSDTLRIAGLYRGLSRRLSEPGASRLARGLGLGARGSGLAV